MKPFNLAAALALTLIAATACSTGTTTGPATSSNSAGTSASSAGADAGLLTSAHWQLRSATDTSGKPLTALFVQQDKPVELNFQDGRISSRAACNTLTGSYSVRDGVMHVGQLISTMIGCPPALQAQDSRIGQLLEEPLKIHRLDATTLELLAQDGSTLTFAGQATAETRYGGEGTRVFMEVAAQTKPCSHGVMRHAQCLQVREVMYDERGLEQGKRGAYENFYGDIEGYTHTPGTRNVLRLKRFNVKNPPADGASQAYVLDMVVESGIEN
jgi:heat shock protein HslJ